MLENDIEETTLIGKIKISQLYFNIYYSLSLILI